MEEIRQRRINRAVYLALIAITGCSLIVAAFVYSYAEDLGQVLRNVQHQLEDLESRLTETSKFMAVGNISLYFIPYETNVYVEPNSITYLLGFAGIENLTNIVSRPIFVQVTFEPIVDAPENGTITYDYTPSQSLEIAAPDLDRFEMPWGAYPIVLRNFSSGDVILWHMDIRATVSWLNNEVTSTTLRVTYKFNVV